MGEAMECFVDEYGQYNVGKVSFGILFGIRVNGNGQMNASRWPRTLPTTVAFEHRTKLGSCTKQSIQQMWKVWQLCWTNSTENNSSSFSALSWVEISFHFTVIPTDVLFCNAREGCKKVRMEWQPCLPSSPCQLAATQFWGILACIPMSRRIGHERWKTQKEMPTLVVGGCII